MALSFTELSKSILEAETDAVAKSKAIKGQDALALMGCTGSGKTTVFSYLLGSEFKLRGLTLEQVDMIQGAEIGNERTSKTRGMQVASSINGLFPIDLAGSLDTAGSVKDLGGAMYCSAVLTEPSSLRVALVVGLGRLTDLCNERGKAFVGDVEHVAGLFNNLQEHLDSVGMLVTAKPEVLMDKGPDAVLEEVNKALQGLVANAVAADGCWDSREGMKTTSAGLALLKHLQSQCEQALETAKELPEGDAQGLLSRLASDRRAVFPVNVIQSDQRECLKQFLENLKPVSRPSASMCYNLPKTVMVEVTSKLELEDAFVRDDLRKLGLHWATNPGLSSRVFDLLQLLGILLTKRLVPMAVHLQGGLCHELLSQNKQAAKELAEGSVLGNEDQADLALGALEAMENVRDRLKTGLPSLRLDGWSSCRSAVKEGATKLREQFSRLLPEDLAEVHWSSMLAQQVLSLLRASKKLGAGGSSLCSEWAEKLKEHLRSLKGKAAECSAATAVVRALTQLDELRQFLPPVAELLGFPPECCPCSIFEEAKKAVLSHLGQMSEKMQGELTHKMKEAHALPGELADRKLLEELCNSSELNDILDGGLVDTFLMVPLSAVLVPKQEDIDSITAQLRQASDPSDPWCPLLERVVQRIQDAGELGPNMIKAAGLDFTPLLDEVVERIELDTAMALKAVKRLSAPPRTRAFTAAASQCSGDASRWEEDWDEEEEKEEADRAAQRLGSLLPADALLKLFCRPDSKSALMALRSLAWKLQKTLKSLLKQAKKEKTALTCAGGLDDTALASLVQLNACLPLSRSVGEALDANECSGLQQAAEEAAGFVREPVQQQLGEWAKAEAGARGWLALFDQHVRRAQQIKPLAEEEVHAAWKLLVEKATTWYEGHLTKAKEASEQEDAWQAFIDHGISEGLNFEESALCSSLDLRRQDFRELVEVHVQRWLREAESAPATPAMQARLRATATALERLPGCARGDPRTQQLLDALSKPLERLEAALSTSESNFQKDLAADRFLEACQWLGSLQDAGWLCKSLKKALQRAAEETLESLSTNGDEEDVKRSARRARSLIQSCDGIRSQHPRIDAEAGAKQLGGKLQTELDQHRAEAAKQLQRALEGRGPPSRALAVLAALSDLPRNTVAEQAMREFIEAQRNSLHGMSTEQMSGWIVTQDTVRCSRRSMPDELSSSREYDDLIRYFAKSFSVAVKADQEKVEQLKSQREWGEVKQASEQLRDVIENTLELEILKPERTQLKSLRRFLGVGSAGALQQAKDDVKRGDFFWAIRTLASGGESVEQELCEVIQAELCQHLNPTDMDEAAMSRRLTVLKAFLEAVGGHPPEELRGLVQDAREVCARLKPLFDKVARAAEEEGIAAASGQGTDLLRTSKSLLRLQHLSHSISPECKARLDKALDGFFSRIRHMVERVANDVQGLDVAALALSLEPLRHCLKDAEKLSSKEEEVLLQRLQSGAASPDLTLKEWVKQSLAQALQALCDPSTLQNEAKSACLSRISQRCQVADKLHGLLQTPRVDLAALKEEALQHRAACVSSLQNPAIVAGMESFNPPFKALRLLATQLPQLQEAASYLQEVQAELRSARLDPLVEKLRTARSVNEAVLAILDLRSLASAAPDVYDQVMACLGSGLVELQRNPSFSSAKTLNLLGSRLAQDKPLGQQVIGEFPGVFGAAREQMNNEVFRRCGEVCDPAELVARLTRESGLGGTEWGELKAALEGHEQESAQLRRKYFGQEATLDAINDQAKRDLKAAVLRIQAANSPASRAEAGRQVLTHLAMCYSLVKCGRVYKEEPLNENWAAPHRGQMLTVFRLLHAHKSDTDPEELKGWFDWPCLQGATGAQQPSQKRATGNHLAQVLTGEGKCLTLALVAAFLALQGVESDVVCYHKILTQQDSRATRDFYSFVGVEDCVRYVTFDELCRERLATIKQAAANLLGTGLSTDTQRSQSNSQRVLLIDEVDVFFSRRFVGQTWDGGFKLGSQPAKALVEFIFEQHRQGQDICNIASEQAFQDLLADMPQEMHGAMEVVAQALMQNVKSWSKPEPVVDQVTGQIGYKDRDEVDYNMSYANKTVFAYLSFALEGDETPKVTREQAAEHNGIDLFCGRFSFAELPKEYSCIMGVTGTLRDLLNIPELERLLKEEYGFKHFTFVPSVFGQSRLSFKPGEHVVVLENEADWLARIELEVEEQRKRNNAVLVFFKNVSQLQSYPAWDKMETLTERTESNRRAGYIAAANASKRTTLVTRAFGRGVDFQMPESHELAVLQTFLSSTPNEWTQIKGRTGRQGNPGLYKLILCAEHLRAKMAFQDEDIQALKSSSGEEIQRLLERKQREKTANKIADLKMRKERAVQLERDTKAWESLLFNPDAPAASKLQQLAALNSQTCGTVHYTVLLDNSGSMWGQPWEELTEAFQSFRSELQRDVRVAASTRVSVCLFNSCAHTVQPSHSKPEEVGDIGHHWPGWGTSFAAAFAEAHALIGRSQSQTREAILFLTDGGDRVPKREINRLLADHGERIRSLTCVALGAGADMSQLKEIGALFTAANVSSVKMLTASNKADLVQQFVGVASDQAIHY